MMKVIKKVLFWCALVFLVYQLVVFIGNRNVIALGECEKEYSKQYCLMLIN